MKLYFKNTFSKNILKTRSEAILMLTYLKLLLYPPHRNFSDRDIHLMETGLVCLGFICLVFIFLFYTPCSAEFKDHKHEI